MFILWIVVLALTLQACSQSQSQSQSILEEGYTVTNPVFSHRVAVRRSQHQSNIISIYINGDGQAWLRRNRPATIPTVEKNPIDELMAKDSNNVLYLGRPCYHGLHRYCELTDWTFGRYSEAVVESMVQALRQALHNSFSEVSDYQLVLVGYSGGGAIAALLASRIPNITRVIILAGNLDTEAWTQWHGYTTLFNSLNPRAVDMEVPSNQEWYFLYGKKDKNIPFPQVAPPIIWLKSRGHIYLLNDVTHSEGWKPYISRILDLIDGKP